MNEFEILENFIKPLTKTQPSSLHLTDDACVLDKLNTKQFVVTTDAITENIHFFPDTSAEIIAHKLVATNLSDIAAMAAKPKYYLLSAILPKSLDKKWFSLFSTSLSRINKKYDILIVGGDTIRHNGPLSLSITMIGEVDKYSAVTRSGAKEGDDVYVTATIGNAAIGLMIKKNTSVFDITNQDRAFFLNEHELTTPRVEIGEKLINIASSMIDISDGFMQDAMHISNNSKVCIDINLESIPFSKPLKSLIYRHDILEDALTGGEDYELLFTAPKKYESAIKEISDITGVEITKIGKVIQDTNSLNNKVSIKDLHGKKIQFKKFGYIH